MDGWMGTILAQVLARDLSRLPLHHFGSFSMGLGRWLV